ncbi:MAG: hypothetical protein M1832_000479 [Thelocarpon impressellum]|nr:MAG: hypothetical protein M1832_000479 [Thelocarpon impressellum]
MRSQGITSLALAALFGSGVSSRAALGIRDAPPTGFPTPAASPSDPLLPSNLTAGINSTTEFVLQIEFIQDGSSKIGGFSYQQSSTVYVDFKAESEKETALRISGGVGLRWSDFAARPEQAIKFVRWEDGRVLFLDQRLILTVDEDALRMVGPSRESPPQKNAIVRWKFDQYDNLVAYNGSEPRWMICRSKTDTTPPTISLAEGTEFAQPICWNIHLRGVPSQTQRDGETRAWPPQWRPGTIPPPRYRPS